MSSSESEDQASPAPTAAASLLVQEHALVIGRLCMALLGTQSEAEEALRETLQAALDEGQAFSGVGSQRAWLAGVARRVCARRVELRARERSLASGAEPSVPPANDERRSAARRARGWLEHVRPTEREALVLRFTAGLDCAEIAHACAIDEASVRARISRGLLRVGARANEDER